MKISSIWILPWAALALTPIAYADPTVAFISPTTERARIVVDGRSRTLEVGETSREGLHVIAIEKDSVIVDFGGQKLRLHRRGTRPEVLPNSIDIERDRSGMFVEQGRIEGLPVTFIVDTGASHVVLSESAARRMRLRYSRKNRVNIQTASGTSYAYQVAFKSVSIGGLYLTNVPALISRGNFPAHALLGMSFLERLSVVQDGNIMAISR